MMGPTHILVSVSTTAVVCSITHQPPEVAALLIVGSVCTPTLPDWDLKIPWPYHDRKHHRWRDPETGKLFRIVHRRPGSHSPWAAGMFTIWTITALALIPWPQFVLDPQPTVVFTTNPTFALLLGLGMGFGVLWHQIADGLTLGGGPFLYPFTDRDVHLLPPGFRIRVNGPTEVAFTLLVILAVAYYFWTTYHTQAWTAYHDL